VITTTYVVAWKDNRHRYQVVVGRNASTDEQPDALHSNRLMLFSDNSATTVVPSR